MPTETLEPPPATVEAEPSPSFDTSQLDAILEKMRPMPKMETSELPAVAPEPPSKAPEKTAEAPAPAPDPFTPPPSVLGEAEISPVEDEYGEIPEKPARGFKNPEEEASWALTRKRYGKLKEDFFALKKQAAATPKVDENTAAQIADLAKRNEELNAIVERRAIEDHPYVKSTFDEPRRQILSIAQKALEKIDVDPHRIGKILALQGRERIEAVDELYGEIESPSTREKVTNALAQIDLIDEKKAEFLEDRKGNVERMTQAEKAERYRLATQQQEGIRTSINTTIDDFNSKYGFPFLKEATEPGSEQWNNRIKEDKAWIEHMALKNTDINEHIKSLVAAREAPYLLKWARSLQTENQDLKKKVSEYEGTLPSLKGSAPSESPINADNKDEEFAAAGILPTDSLAIQSRKLMAYWNSRV